MARPCRIILVGMMGSGKTSVGRVLSRRTGWLYHDNDELLHRLFGATPRQILTSGGESVLDQAESAALALGLASGAPCIVAAAGGAIVDPADRHRLRAGGIVVWLRAELATLMRRTAEGEHRPWAGTSRRTWLEAAASAREPLYRSVADVVLDTDRASPATIAGQVLQRLAGMTSCRGLLPRPIGPAEREPSVGPPARAP